MPASIFSETELARLASFPEEIPGDDLIRAFTLTGADRDLVAIRRGAANRLGLALQLCALRYLGFVPRNLSAAPRSAACFVADQLAYMTRPSLFQNRKRVDGRRQYRVLGWEIRSTPRGEVNTMRLGHYLQVGRARCQRVKELGGRYPGGRSLGGRCPGGRTLTC